MQLPSYKEVNLTYNAIFTPKILDPEGICQYNFAALYSQTRSDEFFYLRKTLWKKFV